VTSFRFVPYSLSTASRSVTFAGSAFNCDKENGVFDCEPTQYTSFFKDRLTQKYKNKKPVPPNNTNIVVEGFLHHVEFHPKEEHPLLFHVTLNNIAFLGKSSFPTPAVTHGLYLTSQPKRNESAHTFAALSQSSSSQSCRFQYTFPSLTNPSPSLTPSDSSSPTSNTDTSRRQEVLELFDYFSFVFFLAL
jgi:hypothetical protein